MILSYNCFEDDLCKFIMLSIVSIGRFRKAFCMDLLEFYEGEDKEKEEIVIVISKFLERHSKAKRRAPSYSRALRRIKGLDQRVVRDKLRSDFQRVRGDRVTVMVGLV